MEISPLPVREKESLEKTAEIRDALERINDAFLAVNKNWKITYINDKAAQLAGCLAKDALGKNLLDVFSESFVSDFPKLVDTAMTTQERQFQEDYFPLHQIWLESHIYPSPTGLSIYFRDITARKKNEEKLAESENRLRTIIQAEPECIKLLGPNCELLEMNPAGLAMIEADNFEQVRGKSVLGLVDPKYQEAFAKCVQDVYNGASGVMEFEIIGLKGSRRWIETHAAPLRNGGQKIISFLSVSRDITGKKEVEQELKKQFDDIQKTNFELDRFVYSVSHDLRAPLTTILGLINVAEREDIPASQHKYLRLIRDSVNRLDGFIKDILDYSKNARGEAIIDKIDFKELVAEAQNRLQPIAESNLSVHVDINEDVPFFSDKTRVEIILNNLFSNAIKFQDHKKESRQISINAKISPDKVSIQFSDNGIGIEAKHVDKIFDMFYRASEKAKGSGLGLYIVKETLVKLGGTINVRSEFGVSTIFDLEIPNLRPVSDVIT
jgi:PAS domain S-box-containing protein